MTDAKTAWDHLGLPWRQAFYLAWEGFADTAIPIGAVVTDGEGKVISSGRNRVIPSPAGSPRGQVSGALIAHAEINALAQLVPAANYKHVLYSTLDACLMCVGAALMSTVSILRYAGADPFSGGGGFAGLDRYAWGLRPDIRQLSDPHWAGFGSALFLAYFMIGGLCPT